MVVGRLQLAGHGEMRRGFVSVPRQGCSGSESPVGGVCELYGASTTMVGVLKELLVLTVAPATVVGAKRRRWRSDKVWCGNARLRWASFLAKVSAVVSLIMAEPVRVSMSPLPRRRRHGGLAMVVLWPW